MGSFLAVELLKKGYKIYGLARANKDKSAKERVYDALKFVYEDDFDKEFIDKNVEVIEGDIIKKDLGIERKILLKMSNKIDILLHCAAIINQKTSLDKIRLTNVEGTKNVLFLARELKKRGRLKKINHLSTIFVVGKEVTEFTETMLDLGQEFYSSYEKSKFEAELVVSDFIKEGLNISIFRPSLIMGDSIKGKIKKFNLFYQPLRCLANGIFDIFPADLSCSQNFIHVDTVASAIVVLLEDPEAQVYHICSPNALSVRAFLESAQEFFGFKMPEFIPAEQFNFDKLTFVQKALAEPFLPYFNYKTVFVLENTISKLKRYNFFIPELKKQSLLRIFDFCNLAGFIKKE